MLDLVEAAALLSAGLGAGFVNTLAGGGSVLTLPILEWVTGSPGLANGTNRVSVLLMTCAGVAGFHSGRAVPWKFGLRAGIPAAIGAVFGAWIATRLDPGAMRVALAVAVVFVAIAALVRPPQTARLRGPLVPLAFLGIGVYMGFLQAGAGFALLAVLVGGLGLDLVRANGAKLLIVLCATIPALLVFGLSGQVHLPAGLVLACGTMGGAWIASRLAVKRGGTWIRGLVLLAALAAIVKLLLFPSGPR